MQHYLNKNFLKSCATKSCSGFCCVRKSLISVLQKKNGFSTDTESNMVNVRIKSDKITPFENKNT